MRSLLLIPLLLPLSTFAAPFSTSPDMRIIGRPLLFDPAIYDKEAALEKAASDAENAAKAAKDAGARYKALAPRPPNKNPFGFPSSYLTDKPKPKPGKRSESSGTAPNRLEGRCLWCSDLKEAAAAEAAADAADAADAAEVARTKAGVEAAQIKGAIRFMEIVEKAPIVRIEAPRPNPAAKE